DEGRDRAVAELEMHDRSVANVGPAAGESVSKVAVLLEVVTPGLAPEAPGDRASLDPDGGEGLTRLLEPNDLAGGVLAPYRHRHVGSPLVPGHDPFVHASASALWRSRATIRSTSASGISVIRPSPLASRRSVASPFFRSIRASIRSSTVPRQTNLWTTTFRCCPIRKARSVAWFSTAGFHQRSKWMTCDAAVRFSPAPPARRDRTKQGIDSSPSERSTRPVRTATGDSTRCA